MLILSGKYSTHLSYKLLIIIVTEVNLSVRYPVRVGYRLILVYYHILQYLFVTDESFSKILSTYSL